MSTLDDGSSSPRSQLASYFFEDLLKSTIADVASECHRIARLGLDRNLEDEEEELRLSAQARVHVADSSSSGEANSKYVVDIFGQTHPAIASEIFKCMNCGRSVMAGRFAPHLEKCMGKGRKACLRATRSSTIARSQHARGCPISFHVPYSTRSTFTRSQRARGSPLSVYAPYSTSRLPNGTNGTVDEYSECTSEEP